MAIAATTVAETPEGPQRRKKVRRLLSQLTPPTRPIDAPIMEVQADIGDRIAAIKYLADSQGPWKSLLELIENAIDEYPDGYRTRREIRLKVVRRGPSPYLELEDFGRGFIPDRSGNPDLRGVVTRVADSVKKSLVDYRGAQGEFAVGLFGFRTLGRELVVNTRTDYGGYPRLTVEYGLPRFGLSATWQMRMGGADLVAQIRPSTRPRPHPGTTVIVRDLHNPRLWSGPKIKRAVEEELWVRLMEKSLTLRICEGSRTYAVQPKERVFSGVHFPTTSLDTGGFGTLVMDLYVTQVEEPEAKVEVLRGKSRSAGATRVYGDIADIDDFDRYPWNVRRLQGWIRFDAARLSGPTRREFAHDAAFNAFVRALTGVEADLHSVIAAQDVERERVKVEALRARLEGDLQRVVRDLPHLDTFRLLRDYLAVSHQGGLGRRRKRRRRRAKVDKPGRPGQGGAQSPPYIRGLPTPQFAADGSKGWRSRYDPNQHAVVVNKSHPDYERESVTQRRWYRYILKLYTKELVLLAFPTGREGTKLLETTIEAQLRAEENL